MILKIGPLGRELNVDLLSQGKTDFRVELKHFPIQPAVIGGMLKLAGLSLVPNAGIQLTKVPSHWMMCWIEFRSAF